MGDAMVKVLLLLVALAMLAALFLTVRHALQKRARRQHRLAHREWSETVYACAESRGEF